jgi:hypothetical protein
MMLLISAAPTHGMSYGSLQFDPYASLRETLTDNVFSTPDDRRHDLISALTPGIKLVYPFRTHQIDLDYHAVLTRYKTYSAERTNDHFVNGSVDLKFGSLVGLKLSDIYMKNHEPRSSSSTGFIEKYTNNTAKASLSYQLADRSKVQVDLGKAAWDFQQSSFRDRREDLFSGYVYYRFQPKTSAFVELDRKKADFSEADSQPLDNTMDSVLLGITWEITKRSQGTVRIGRTWKDYGDASVADYDAWTGSMDIKHRFDESNAVKVTGLRQINETNYQPVPGQLPVRFFVTTGAAAPHRSRSRSGPRTSAPALKDRLFSSCIEIANTCDVARQTERSTMSSADACLILYASLQGQRTSCVHHSFPRCGKSLCRNSAAPPRPCVPAPVRRRPACRQKAAETVKLYRCSL